MNIINSYIYSHIKSDKKNTLFIFITITIAAILISTLSLIFYAHHENTINMAIEFFGNTHFTINQLISPDDLHYITDHPDIEEVITKPDENGMLSVAVRLKNVYKTYPVSEEICEILGFQKNIYDRYPVSYNRSLIGLYNVKDPYTGDQTAFQEMIGSVLPIILLTMGLFVIIIYNIIVTTENRRIKELGLLKSVGISPNQLRGLIMKESVLYCIPAAPIGLIIGYILQTILSHFNFSIVISLGCIVLLVVTVVISSFLPARRIAKLTVIEGIKGKEYAYAMNRKNVKMKKSGLTSRLFGINGTIAGNNFSFYKSMFRTTLISFSLFLTIAFAFQCFMTIWWVHSINLINSSYYDSTASISGDIRQNDNLLKYLDETENEYVLYHQQTLSKTISEDELTDQFIADGGFNIDVTSSIVLIDEGWYMNVYFIGLDDNSFTGYCNKIGANTEDFNDSDAILVNSVRGGFDDKTQNYLPWEVNTGDILTIDARTQYDIMKPESCDVTVKYMTDIYPETHFLPFSYDIYVVVKEDTYYSVLEELNIAIEEDFTTILIKGSIDELPELLSNVETREDKIQQLKDSYDGVSNICMGLIMIFGAVGICSSYSTITGNFKTRGKDIALLRSQGIESNQLKKILYIESVIFCIIPFVISIPFTIAAGIPIFILFTHADLQSVFMNLSYVTMGICVLSCVVSVALSYFINIRRVFKNNIVELIKIN